MPFCSFKDLPPVDGMPHGCAWGYYAREAGIAEPELDQLGRLNLLTPERVSKAAREQIQTGIRVQLDWSMNNVQFPGFNRLALNQKIIDKSNPKSGWIGTDDELHFNTQSSSQWDGFRHVAHQTTGKYYNGMSHEEIISENSTRNGIDAWCQNGGIAGRGVLLDWVRWREITRPEEPLPSPISRYEIPLEELELVARFQGTQFEIGDILVVRTGFVRWHNEADENERRRGTFEQALFSGVHATPAAVEWFWNHHFAAVAGDAVAFEAWPPAPGGACLHEWFLSQFGSPIGEMWDLETLSSVCQQQGRWTFFLTSAPLNVPGGVGSPPNAIAIF